LNDRFNDHGIKNLKNNSLDDCREEAKKPTVCSIYKSRQFVALNEQKKTAPGFDIYFTNICCDLKKKMTISCQIYDYVRIFANNEINIMEVYSVITEKQKKAARYAKAMGHPVRLYVLQLLSEQSCCYSGDLSEVLPIAKATLSQHPKGLKDAGLIQGEIEAPKIKYCINKENWNEARLLLGDIIK